MPDEVEWTGEMVQAYSTLVGDRVEAPFALLTSAEEHRLFTTETLIRERVVGKDGRRYFEVLCRQIADALNARSLSSAVTPQCNKGDRQ